MKNIIRWPGIAVAIVLLALSYFLIEPLLKLVIEQSGSRALSTTVSLDSVQVGWSEQSLALQGLEVADKDNPGLNKVEIDHIAFQIDVLEALSGHLISEQADILGVQFASPRSQSGILNSADKARDKQTESSEGFSLPGLELPDMETLVNKENSLTYQRYQSLKTYIDDEKLSYQNRIDALKDKQKIADYKVRYKEIRNAKGFKEQLKSASKLNKLRKDIEKDLDEAKQLNRDFKQTRKAVQQRLVELKNSPQQEADQLLQHAGIDGGTQKISELLFGTEMKALLKKVKGWIGSNNDSASDAETLPSEELAPERGKGVFVQFEQAKTQPLVWFKRARLGGDLSGLGLPFGFEGEAKHLADQQKLTNQPASLDLNLLSPLVKAASVHAVFDTRTQQKLALNFDIKQYRLSQQALSGNFSLDKALADTQGSLASIDEQLSGSIKIDMNSVSLATTGDEFKKYPALEHALAAEDHISATMKITGSLEAPEVDVDSNIDAVFSKVLKNAASGQVQSYKKQVEQKIETMLQQELAQSESAQNELFDLSNEISGIEDILKDAVGL